MDPIYVPLADFVLVRSLAPMLHVARASEAEVPQVGDPSSWVSRLGLPSAPKRPGRLHGDPTGAELARFRDQVLCGLEWPVILKAAELARRGYHRELLELDARFGQGLPPGIAEASRCVGRRQLSRLRGLRDQRVVRRYLDAIEDGRARGWSPIVYGLVLAVFGIPLRQGLVHYATAVLRGHSAHIRNGSSESSRRLWDTMISPLPAAAAALLKPFPESSGIDVGPGRP